MRLFIWDSNFLNYSYNLDINSLFVGYLTNFCLLYIFLHDSFAMQISIWFGYIILIPFSVLIQFRKSFIIPFSSGIQLILFFKRFSVSVSISRSFIYFDFNILWNMYVEIYFTSCGKLLFLQISFKNYIFFLVHTFVLFVKILLNEFACIFCAFSILFHWRPCLLRTDNIFFWLLYVSVLCV